MFREYASFYDLFYKNKQYSDEVDFIDEVIKKYLPDTKSILDLGCGTGEHAVLLVKEGYQVTGVDRSEEMLSHANQKKSMLDGESREKLEFIRSDIRKLQIDRKFDVICSLFHVISYQISNKDVMETFESAKNHLEEGGLFIFDVWYGPGVLTSKPEYRKKTFQSGTSSVTKIASPDIFTEKNVVKVDYTLLIDESGNEIHEEHYMRYFFAPEIEMFLELHEMKILGIFDGFANNEVTSDTWSVTFITTNKI